MNEYEEILEGFKHFAEARKVFDKYKGKWFSGNDNHVGDVGEYWAIRYYRNLGKDPKLAPKRNSSYDFEADGKLYSVKTMSNWNKKGKGSPVKGIKERKWDFLIAVKLNEALGVNRFCVVSIDEVCQHIQKEGTHFQWWPWLQETEFPDMGV